MEVWKTLSFNDSFQISSWGKLRVLKSKYKSKVGSLKVWRPGGSKNQYARFSIFNKDYYVHRLVLEEFVGPCPEGFQCAHLDGNPQNNKLENLKWVSPLENSSHKIFHGTSGKGEKNSMAKLSQKDVLEITKIYLKKVHPTIISKKFSVKQAYPSKISQGKVFQGRIVCPLVVMRTKQVAKFWSSTSNQRKQK